MPPPARPWPPGAAAHPRSAGTRRRLPIKRQGGRVSGQGHRVYAGWVATQPQEGKPSPPPCVPSESSTALLGTPRLQGIFPRPFISCFLAFLTSEPCLPLRGLAVPRLSVLDIVSSSPRSMLVTHKQPSLHSLLHLSQVPVPTRISLGPDSN